MDTFSVIKYNVFSGKLYTMIILYVILLWCPFNYAYKSEDLNNSHYTPIDFHKTYTSKIWFQQLELPFVETFTDELAGSVLASYALLFSKAHRMVVWCNIARLKDEFTSDDTIHVQASEPCGYVKIVAGIQPSKLSFLMRTTRQLVLQISFLLFDIDSFSEFCSHVSYVNLCLIIPNDWRCPEALKYCGYQKPWIHTTNSSSIVVLLVQRNVRYPCNITYTYTSLERQIAYRYMSNEYHETIHVAATNLTINSLSIKIFTSVLKKWRLHQKLGNNFRFKKLQTCCFAGSIDIYDGFESYYTIVQKQILEYLEEVLNIASTYYITTIIFKQNESLFTSDGEPHFLLTYEKEPVIVQFMEVGKSHTVNNQGLLLHSVFAINVINGGYPNVSVVSRLFNGWNDDVCSFGGYSFIHKIETKTINLTYQQGPFCNGQSQIVPFIGEHGPKHVVFGSFQYWLTIYAFGPWYDMDIDIIIRRSSCEGLFEPMHLCSTVAEGTDSHSHINHHMIRYIKTSNYNILCSTIKQPNNMLAYKLKIYNIKKCIIFQIISQLSGHTQLYNVQAIMKLDIAITIGPKYLPVNDITAERMCILRSGTMDRITNEENIESTYNSQRNASSLTFFLIEYQQRPGLYAMFTFHMISRNKTCAKVGNALTYTGNRSQDTSKGIVEISSFCGKFSFVRQLTYIFKLHLSSKSHDRILYMYSFFESKCYAVMINSMTVIDESGLCHSVVAIHNELSISHSFSSVSCVFENKKNCSLTMAYRVQEINVYISMISLRTQQSQTQLFVSQTI